MYVGCRLCTKVQDPFVLVRESRIYSAVTNKEVCLDELIEQYLSISVSSSRVAVVGNPEMKFFAIAYIFYFE